jgi:MarR-like DNA-binding transcriptional regulator SgrR of sgrS sRNA
LSHSSEAMKRICLLLVALFSATEMASAATRPHYGGTLRMEVRGTLSSFEIAADVNPNRALLRDFLLRNVCDRLVTLDASGTPHPSLAISWRSDGEGRNWYFTVREGIVMHNGVGLTPQTVVTALAAQNPNWHVHADGKQVVMQSDAPVPAMLYELASSRNSVCLAGADGRWIGSGPFQIAEFTANQSVELQAIEDAWQGRPFLDRIRIQMGRSLADELTDFQLGRADAIERDPTQSQPIGGSAVAFTRPVELVVLAFTPNHPAASDPKLRESLARALDRNSIFSVLLRRQGAPSAALLPEWISGYAHLFTVAQDLAGASQLRNPLKSLAPLSLAYDGSDDLSRLIAERVSLNARDAGITLQARQESPMFRSFDADVKLIRVRIESPDPATALTSIGEALDIPELQQARSAASADRLYTMENAVLKNFLIVPIAHIPDTFSIAPGVHDWAMQGWGSVDFANLWVEPVK